MNTFQKAVARMGIKIPSGGDIHFHPYGSGPSDSTVTTRLPLDDGYSMAVHDKPLTGSSSISLESGGRKIGGVVDSGKLSFVEKYRLSLYGNANPDRHKGP